MRAAKLGLWLPIVVCSLLVTAGCQKKKATFTPEPAPAPPAPSATAPGAGQQQQNLGTEGFTEKPLTANEAAPKAGPVSAAELASALKTIYFAYDSEALSDQALAALTADAAWLSAHPDVRVQIEGHCDERGTVEYNLALGERRAASVRDHLARLGITAGRLEIISYGKERPADPGHDEAAWSKNRRAEFRLPSAP